MEQRANNGQQIYDISAEVHTTVNKGFRVKAWITDFGIYINGMMVYPPNDKNTEWTVFTPAVRFGARYVRILEFDKTTTIWTGLCDACVSAVKNYLAIGDEASQPLERDTNSREEAANDKPSNLDTIVPVDWDTPINLEDIPF